MSKSPTTGATRIALERKRQVLIEGYDASHDAEHTPRQLCAAAVAYCLACLGRPGEARDVWPWESESFKPDGFERNMEKAGALIAAALDRAMRGRTADEDLVDPSVWQRLMELIRRIPKAEAPDPNDVEPFI